MGVTVHRIRQNENKTDEVGFSSKARKSGRTKQTRYTVIISPRLWTWSAQNPDVSPWRDYKFPQLTLLHYFVYHTCCHYFSYVVNHATMCIMWCALCTVACFNSVLPCLVSCPVLSCRVSSLSGPNLFHVSILVYIFYHRRNNSNTFSYVINIHYHRRNNSKTFSLRHQTFSPRHLVHSRPVRLDHHPSQQRDH